jgi:hypothetical protein
MSESSSTVVTPWLASLPLPLVDYGGSPQHVTIASLVESARIALRRRYIASTVTITVQWVFSIGDYDTFKEFFITDLDNGASQFTIDLRFPNNMSLSTWLVRIVGNYDATYMDGNWMVKAEMELIHSTLSESSLVIGFGMFLVIPEDRVMLDADGRIFRSRSGSVWVLFLVVGVGSEDADEFIFTDGSTFDVLT